MRRLSGGSRNSFQAGAFEWKLIAPMSARKGDRDRIQVGAQTAYLKQALQDKLVEHRNYINEHGQDDMADVTARAVGLGAGGRTRTDTTF